MRHLMRGILLGLIGFAPMILWAEVRVPTNMTRAERQETLRVIGLGGSSKILSDPYPLGGYSGFEVGIGAATLPVSDLNRLGNKVNNSAGDLSYQTLSIGKGVYNDVDVYLDFSPWNRSMGISEYGGMLRWNFYQAKYLPLSYSAVIHSNVLNLHNALVASTFGGDLLTSVTFRHFAVYFGLGDVRASGRFEMVHTDTGRSELEEVDELHTFIGATTRYDQAFLAVEVDRYTTSVYSAKLGFRF